jgi:hypothetical protein
MAEGVSSVGSGLSILCVHVPTAMRSQCYQCQPSLLLWRRLLLLQRRRWRHF